MLLTAPLNATWVDVVVGEPEAKDFFCLRASPRAMPLASDIPVTIEAGLRDKGAQIIKLFVVGERSLPEPKPEPMSPSTLMESATAFFRRTVKKEDPPAKPPEATSSG